MNQLFNAFKTSENKFIRMLASAFPTWHPPWKQHCHHLLHCHTNVFSFANGDTEPGPARFDTDSIPVGADVCASATMSKHKHLFIDLTPVEGVFLEGVGSKVRVEAKGTLHLNFLDNKGEIHTFKIPDSYFIPKLELTLLCPQQWAKQREQEFGFEESAQFITKGDFSRFQWDHNQHSFTVPMDSAANLPILTTAPSFKRSAMSILSFFPLLVSDAEDSDDEDEPDDATVRTTNAVADHFPFNTVDTAKPVMVEDPILPKDQAEFLRLHERMGHSSFHLLQQMSMHGLLPSKFKKCRVPGCASWASNTRSHGGQELILLPQLEGQPSQSQVIAFQLTNSSHQLQVSSAKSRDGSHGKGTTRPLSLWITILI